ncbi:MAG: glycosyltransferase [Patescibacteria group bacterium]
MDKNIALSYLVTTRNKLPYLRVTLERLISEKKDDENILVADGASTDGTKEYLDGLKKSGGIDYYVSEADSGVAHALNKLMLVSKGELLKFIADDDAFHYPSIQACKRFMLERPEIDLINTEGGVVNSNNTFKALHYAEDYKKYKNDHTPFSFCELGVMFRRSSLPIIGLRNSFKRADMEMSLRVTTGKAKIAWYTGYSYVNIVNSQSISHVHKKEIKKETDRLNKFYLGKDPDNLFVEKLKVARNKLRMLLSERKNRRAGASESKWTNLLLSADRWLEAQNAKMKPEFIYN